MKIEPYTQNGITLALISSAELVITDVQSALDLMMTVSYQTGANRMVLDKQTITEDFFILSRGLAGEILQKYQNYGIKAAIYGDFTRYTSKPLHDFLWESNRGKDFFFLPTQEEAIQQLLSV